MADPFEDEIGIPAPAGLPAQDAADLAELVRDARERQSRDLHAAIGAAFDHIPRLLRGPIRRILGG